MHQKDIEIFAYINILDIVPEDDVDNRLLVINLFMHFHLYY